MFCVRTKARRTPPNMPSISFQMEKQKAKNWCWAAVAVSVARYFDDNSQWHQCRVAQLVLRRAHREGRIKSLIRDSCTKPVPEGCNRPWDLQEALEQVGRPKGEPKAGYLSFEQVQRKIDARRPRPVCVRIEWDSGGGHYVVVSGCHIDRKGVRYVEVEDPKTGTGAWVRYSHFVRHYAGRGGWSHTYLV